MLFFNYARITQNSICQPSTSHDSARQSARRYFFADEDREAYLSWLKEYETGEIQTLRQNVEKGLPCGEANFIRRLGKMVGCQLEYRPQGRPEKAEDEK